MDRVQKNTVALHAVTFCKVIINLFVGTFLVAEIFMMTGGDVSAIGWFLLVEFSALFVLYMVASYLCKKIKPCWIVRASVLISSGMLLAMLLWPDMLESHYLLLGAVFGMASGLFWGANNYFISRSFNKENTTKFVAWFLGLASVARVVFPFTLGALIDLESLYVTTVVVLGIGIIQIFATFFIEIPVQSSRSLDMRKYFRTLKEKQFVKPTMQQWFATMLKGLASYPTATVIIILTMTVYGTHMSLGALTSVFALTSVAFIVIFRRLKGRAKIIFLCLGMVLPILASGSLLLSVGYVTVALHQGLFMSFRKVFQSEEQSMRLNSTKFWGGEEFTLESNLLFESALFCGRMVAGLMLVIIGIIGATYLILALTIITMTVAFSVSAFLLQRWKGKYAQ